MLGWNKFTHCLFHFQPEVKKCWLYWHFFPFHRYPVCAWNVSSNIRNSACFFFWKIIKRELKKSQFYKNEFCYFSINKIHLDIETHTSVKHIIQKCFISVLRNGLDCYFLCIKVHMFIIQALYSSSSSEKFVNTAIRSKY